MYLSEMNCNDHLGLIYSIIYDFWIYLGLILVRNIIKNIKCHLLNYVQEAYQMLFYASFII